MLNFQNALGCAVTPQRFSQLLQGAVCSQIHADPALGSSVLHHPCISRARLHPSWPFQLASP